MRVAVLGTLVVATAVSAANIAVSVGANNGLNYSPSSVQAAAGDIITFTFESGNHTATQSTFAKPCTKAGANALNSGFMPVTSATLPTFKVTVNSSDPLWFYCDQDVPIDHCKVGQVFAVNPRANETFAQFQSNAEKGGSGESSTTSSTSGESSTSAGSSSSGASTAATGSASSGASTGTATGSAASSSTTNGAVAVSSNFAGLLAFVGLVAGLAL